MAQNHLAALKATPLTGDEELQLHGSALGASILDFWRWSTSDLLANTTRGVLAEFIVARALGIDTQTAVREEWASWDLLTPEGIKVEIKSSAYVQSWAQKKESVITFGIAESHGWNNITGEYDTIAKRQSDVYVFCLHTHKDKETADPLNLDQWVFYVVPTQLLNEKLPDARTVGLRTIQKLFSGPVGWEKIRDKVLEAAGKMAKILESQNQNKAKSKRT